MRTTLLILALALGGHASAEPVAPLPYDHILRYDELTKLLHEWADARPNLVKLESIGTTPMGRPIWFLTLTSDATGPAQEKPALIVDGNMHATEWAGGVAALHFVRKLLDSYGSDERVTRLLDTRTIYVLPRMTPDGVDATLDQGRFIRSVDRPYPSALPQPGIIPSDVNGDGRSLFMRFRDPNGPWKPYVRDARLLVPRAPDETGGDYWRVLPEGMIEGYDGVTIANEPEHEALDFGANFPADRGETPSQTAGTHPTSEPEVAAYVAAIARRPNIVAHVTCHTFGGLVLTPPVNLDEQLPDSDRLVYETLGGQAAALTGYRAISYLDLRSVGRERQIPSAFGWLYNRRGIYSFITEFWNPLKAAGISLENTTASAWLWGFHPVEDELKLLRWSDKELDGDGFVAWQSFNHPQLGPVEIGGFDLIRYWYNVPFDRLEKEVAPHSEWLIQLGLATPRLVHPLVRGRARRRKPVAVAAGRRKQRLASDQRITAGARSADRRWRIGGADFAGRSAADRRRIFTAARTARGTQRTAFDGELVGIHPRHTRSRGRRLDRRGARRHGIDRQGKPRACRKRSCRTGVG